MSRKDMALRTRIFAVIMKRISQPVEEVRHGDFPQLRAKRQALQASRMGRLAFGTADERATIEDRVVSLDGADIRLRIYRPHSGAQRLPVVISTGRHQRRTPCRRFRDPHGHARGHARCSPRR